VKKGSRTRSKFGFRPWRRFLAGGPEPIGPIENRHLQFSHLEDVMRKTIAVVLSTGALLFGGAGIANAAVESSTIPSSTTTTVVAQPDNTQNQKSDKTGLWGLLGLLGLGGLVGLRGRRETAGPGTITRGQTPHA
jgi:MYXO-CTERM domain-containing protein